MNASFFFCWKLFLQQKSSWPSKFLTQLSMMNHLKTCRWFKAGTGFQKHFGSRRVGWRVAGACTAVSRAHGLRSILACAWGGIAVDSGTTCKGRVARKKFPSSFVFLRIPDLVKLEKTGWFYQFLLLKHMLRCMCRGVKLFCTKNVGVSFAFLCFSCKGTGRVHQWASQATLAQRIG